MELTHLLHPNATGLTLAAAAVVAGAPLFNDGLRAFRLRRKLRAIEPSALRELPDGFAYVHGRVALESPLFSPLSGKACAGFGLEVRAVGLAVLRRIDVRRPFRLIQGRTTAHVSGARARWSLAVADERRVKPGEALTEGLRALLAGVPEALWWRRAGGTLHLRERVLAADADCHVVGSVRGEAVETATVEWIRTGTDATAVAPAPARRDPDVWIGGGDHLDFLLVSDRAPRPQDLRIPASRAIGVVIGPALSLAGMLYLASAADFLRAMGRP